MARTLSEHQEDLMKLLELVDDSASSANVRYHLAYGTALGSRRDGRIIPWDYDLDIVVPLSEISRLCAELRHRIPEQYVVYVPGDRDFDRLFPRLARKGVDQNLLHIDIFPTIRSNAQPRQILLFLKVSKFLRALFRLRNSSPQNSFMHSRWKKKVAAVLRPPLKILPPRVIIWSYARLVSAFSADSGRYAFNIAGSYGRREIFDAKMFTTAEVGRLAGLVAPLPGNVHAYLRQLYGRYEIHPPLAEQEKHKSHFDNYVAPRVTG